MELILETASRGRKLKLQNRSGATTIPLAVLYSSDSTYWSYRDDKGEYFHCPAEVNLTGKQALELARALIQMAELSLQI